MNLSLAEESYDRWRRHVDRCVPCRIANAGRGDFCSMGRQFHDQWERAERAAVSADSLTKDEKPGGGA